MTTRAPRLADSDLEAALAATREHHRLASRGLESRGAIGFIEDRG